MPTWTWLILCLCFINIICWVSSNQELAWQPVESSNSLQATRQSPMSNSLSPTRRKKSNVQPPQCCPVSPNMQIQHINTSNSTIPYAIYLSTTRLLDLSSLTEIRKGRTGCALRVAEPHYPLWFHSWVDTEEDCGCCPNTERKGERKNPILML